MHMKQFLSPADVARELDISTSTVLRLIHAGDLPAIAVSARIYRIPMASFEMFTAGTLTQPAMAPLGPLSHMKLFELAYDAFDFFNTKQAWLSIARLRAWCNRAYFNKAKPKCRHSINHHSVFIQPRR